MLIQAQTESLSSLGCEGAMQLHTRNLVAILGLGLCVAIMLGAIRARAEELVKPNGPVILEISGKISRPNVGKAAHFDRALFESLPQASVTTATPWTEGKIVFEGVFLKELLDAVGANGSKLTAVALNDYQAVLPREDWQAYDVLIAIKMNGEYMRIRDMGPLWIIYPLDDAPSWALSGFHARMVWQLREIVVQ
jgi:hypothetical protein